MSINQKMGDSSKAKAVKNVKSSTSDIMDMAGK